LKAFYYDFFHIPKQGKIREKVLMSHVVLTAVLVIVYLLAISGSAYAFHTSAERVHNTIKAAHFDAQLQILDENGMEIDVEPQADSVLLAALEQPGSYEVIVRPGGTAETGFCTMQLAGVDYTTAQLGVSVEAAGGYRDGVSFIIQAYEPVYVSFQSYWGTSAAYAAYNAGTMDADLYLVGGEYIEVGDPNNTWMYLEEEAEETEEAEQTEETEQFEEVEEEAENTEVTEEWAAEAQTSENTDEIQEDAQDIDQTQEDEQYDPEEIPGDVENESFV